MASQLQGRFVSQILVAPVEFSWIGSGLEDMGTGQARVSALGLCRPLPPDKSSGLSRSMPPVHNAGVLLRVKSMECPLMFVIFVGFFSV